MKKNIIIWIMAVCFLLTGIAPVLAAEESTGQLSPSGSCKTLDAERSLLGIGQLTENATSVILYETNSQTMMHAWNADERTDPASLVKIMTGLLVAEKGTMTDAVTVSESVLSSIASDAATADLQVDEVLTVEELMYCMLVSSANDAAAVLAEHISGSQTAFVRTMNDYAKSIGCTNTNFENVHGLYHENQYSTARDLAKILEAALANKTFRTVFGTTHYELQATNKHDARMLSTGNFLMSTDDVQVHYDERVTGGRTGVDNAGYRSLATVAQSGNMELICILLGAESVLDENGYSVRVFGGYSETSSLLSKGFDGMHLAQVVRHDQVVAQKSVTNGDCDVVLGPVDSVFAILPQNVKLKDLTYRYVEGEQLSAPITQGDIVSKVEIWHNNLCVAQTELYAMNRVNVLTADAAEDTQNNGGWTVFWVILLIVLSCIVLIFLLRFVSRTVRSRRRSRTRQYRRRSR